jgi:hypothetical protein
MDFPFSVEIYFSCPIINQEQLRKKSLLTVTGYFKLLKTNSKILACGLGLWKSAL